MNKLAEFDAPVHNFPYPKIDLIESDGVPLETAWHHRAISLMIDALTCLWQELTDFFVGGDMFLYFSEEHARNRDFRGPDFFYVKGVDRFKERRWWATWEEGGRYPNLIMELLSESTAEIDRTTKKDLYERVFRTPEYYCYDPDTRKLEGWRLDARQRYQPMPPNERGWLWSEELQLWVGTWDGEYLGLRATWLRFYDKAGNLVPTHAELERQRAEKERVHAEEERQRAEAERQKAEAERQKAEAERGRAEAAEAELARLKQRRSEGKEEKQGG